MSSRMELFEQIRRDRDREGLSTRALAARHGVHRRAVRQALASPVPPVKRTPAWRPAPKLGGYHALIDGWLLDDLEAPRKQRHTARRVWQRLVEEHGAVVSERQVSRYVRGRRRALGDVGEAFVPQHHPPGAEAGVDWGEAVAVIDGEQVTVHLFSCGCVIPGRRARACSCARLSRRFWRRTRTHSSSLMGCRAWCRGGTTAPTKAGWYRLRAAEERRSMEQVARSDCGLRVGSRRSAAGGNQGREVSGIQAARAG
jgi:hypothetical protein